MQIVRCEAILVRIPLRTEFRLAYQSYDAIDGVVFRIELRDGTCGFGFAAPDPEVTGESPRDSFRALDEVARSVLMGGELDRVVRYEETLAGLLADRPAARAAVSVALWDALGRSIGQPVWRMWGLWREEVETSVTICICDVQETVERALEWVGRGVRVLKVKVGQDWQREVERLSALRAQVGPRVRLRVDCNQALSRESAWRFLSACRRLDVELVEQPVAVQDLEGLSELSRPRRFVFADESVRSLGSLQELAKFRFQGGAVLKLQKNGGITELRRLSWLARHYGMGLMLGCNDESRISMAASLHFALAEPSFDHWDLDGHLDLVGDPGSGGLELREGCLRASSRPGFGVEVRL